MTVRAKFYVQEIAQTTWGGRVKLVAVARGSDNKEWASATPSGSIEMTILNDVALKQFVEPGTEFFVDFSLAPKGEEGMG
jgi:hypothetical protein